ncbi:hypothetical protein [Flavobacterium agrisoli]|uniref:Curlin associated repeat-containing protein n=1 Tax=Flavobacterium agrisoli TaxID=2793066 RepID=A0A934PMG1_9FLAO|nr:hypothetical protein [Flavobacterium agrisoli]MBK0369171.1 hypothetical protein [Flavobacterium agrisoli]
MKTYKFHIVFLGLSIWATALHAQSNKEENPEFKNYSSAVFDSKNSSLSIVSKMAKSEQKQLNQQLQQGVLIQQIGDFNTATAILKAKTTKVATTQLGNNNDFLLVKNAKSITQNIVQQGNNNKITDFTLYTHRDVNMEMIQKGDNQKIENFGTNSISEDMKITQNTNGAKVILINK